MWLSRGAVAAGVVMLIVLKTVGIANVTSRTHGDTTVYSVPLLGPVFFGALGIIACVLAIVYWMQQGWFYRGVSVALFGISIFVLFNAPTGINHRVVVTPEYFFHRVGSWYSPVETKVDFKSLAYVSIREEKRARNERKTYELRCITKEGAETSVPLYDMMKKALPEILKRAADHEVVIGESPDGRVIRSDL